MTPDRPAVDLVIFDCDGVLIDSEIIACSVAVATLAAHGLEIGLEEFLGFVGRSARDIRALLERRFGALPASWEAVQRETLFARFRSELKAMPGAAATVGSLGRPVCVASSSGHERLRLTLGAAGLHDLFAPAIFSATEVARGKPAPDLFLHAAARMGAAPGRCLVVEDSPAGVTAAVAAGMRAIGFVGGSHCRPGHAERLRAAGAERVIDRLPEVAALIRAGHAAA
ncbi:MAG: HAD family hydrolase [Alphaproteobacteria bacterium]|nr:HAD family hydrolase [Alphaproteobacteria bacterium]